MKKTLLFLLALVILFSLASCGYFVGNNPNGYEENSNPSENTTPSENLEAPPVVESPTKDFIDEISYYSREGTVTYCWESSDGHVLDICGEKVNHCIELTTNYGSYSNYYYNLEGKYKTLTFKVYAEDNGVISFIGDNDVILGTVNVERKKLPVTCTIDLQNTNHLVMKSKCGNDMYLFDATISTEATAGNTGETIPSDNVGQGKTQWDFVDEIKPYASEGSPWRSTSDKGNLQEICGVKYNHWIRFAASYDFISVNTLYYNLDGKYTTLTFKAYTDDHGSILNLYDENESLIKTINVAENALPAEYTVDLTGVKGLKFSGTSAGNLYVFDATIR